MRNKVFNIPIQILYHNPLNLPTSLNLIVLDSNQHIQFCIAMMTDDYSSYIQNLSNSTQLLKITLVNNKQTFKTFILTLPPQVYKFLWVSQIKQGFYEAISLIKKGAISFLRSCNSIIQNEEVNNIVLTRIIPEVINYQRDIQDSQELFKRIKTIKKQWELNDQMVGCIIGYLQMNKIILPQGSQKFSDLLKSQLIPNSPVNYLLFAEQILNISIGESLYLINKNIMPIQSIFKKLIQLNRQNLEFLLQKFQATVITFGSILSRLCLNANNTDQQSQLKNILILFLIFEYWKDYQYVTQMHIQNIVTQIISQCFSKMFYLLYSQNYVIIFHFLRLLAYSKIQIQTKLIYHLIALNKLCISLKNQQIPKLIQNVWQKKNMKRVPKIGDYLFLIRYVDFNQYQQIMKSIGPVKNQFKYKSKKIQLLHIWIKTIETQLKKFNLEKIYLSLQGLRKFLEDYNKNQNKIQESERPNAIILRLAVTIIQRISQKIKFRYNCQNLCTAIMLQLAQIIDICYTTKVSFDESSANLGIFQCFYIKGKPIDPKSILQFHEEHNYQENISNILSIKLLKQGLQDISNDKPEDYQNLFEQNCFQFQLYTLFKKDIQYTGQRGSQSLLIIIKLLALKSNNITNNLLVNYAYKIFGQSKITQEALPKFQSFSCLLNKDIDSNLCQQRTKLFLQMGFILEAFDNIRKHKEQISLATESTSRRYFFFLRHNQHKEYYLKYSQIYQKHNYLQEAIHFIQLYYLKNPTKKPESEIKLKAAEIYLRLSKSFRNSQKYIKKKHKIQNNQLKTIFSDPQRLNILMDTIVHSLNHNKYQKLFIHNVPIHQNWFHYYSHALSFIIGPISVLKVSQQIEQSLLIFNIVYLFLKIKLKQYKDQPNVLSSKLSQLSIKVSHLANEKIQLLFYRLFLWELQAGDYLAKLQQCYLQSLLKNKQSDQLRQYLRPKQQQKEFQRKYLRYILKDNFQQRKYLDNLVLIEKFSQKTSMQNISQIQQIELQCRYNTMFNYSIDDCLGFLKKKCETSAPIDIELKKKYFFYYFKIYRLLYQRYFFTNQQHNQIFLDNYFKFIKKNNILTTNKQYISQSIFYLLRFTLQKFYYTYGLRNYADTILEQFAGNLNFFVPFSDYLYKKISNNDKKNAIIETILVTVLPRFPQQSIWIISFAIFFQISQKKRENYTQQNKEIDVVKKICQKISQQIIKDNNLMKKIDYIQQLITLAVMTTDQKKQWMNKVKEIPIPQNLCYIFDAQYMIYSIQQIKILGKGKSDPLQFTFNLKNTLRQKKQVKVIFKLNDGCKKYWIESNTAYFFYQLGLIDKQTKYRILHLSKYLIAIQYVQNCGTIDELINKYCSQIKLAYNDVQLEYQQRQQNKEQNRKQARYLQIFINHAQKFQPSMSQVLLNINKKIKNAKDWWISYTNFVRTLAQWSYLGYVIGLGDRHKSNILMNVSGKVIHIDFQYALDTGFKLPCPQWVPFRLTKAFTQPLGILGVYGMFYSDMIAVAKQFEDQEADVWKALSHFSNIVQNNQTLKIKQRSIFKKYKSIEEGITTIIQSAINPQNLQKMYLRWDAFV